MIERGGDRYQFFAVRTSRLVELQFRKLVPKAVLADGVRLEQFRLQLNAISGIAIPAEKLRGRPSFHLGALDDPAALSAFLAAWDALVAELPGGA